MAVSVQIVSREASEQLTMKYSDLAPVPTARKENAPEIKRLTLQSFLVSNYANSPRRRLSVEDLCDKVSPSCGGGGPVLESQRRQREFFPTSKPNEDSIIISLTSLAQDTLGPMLQLRNCMATPTDLIKKSCTGLARSKTYHEMSWKYKLFYLCGVSNIDMVDNYVSLPRSAAKAAQGPVPKALQSGLAFQFDLELSRMLSANA